MYDRCFILVESQCDLTKRIATVIFKLHQHSDLREWIAIDYSVYVLGDEPVVLGTSRKATGNHTLFAGGVTALCPLHNSTQISLWFKCHS